MAAFTTLAENFLPQLMSLPKSIVQASGGSAVFGGCSAEGSSCTLNFLLLLLCQPVPGGSLLPHAGPPLPPLQTVVRSTLSLTFVIAAARVVFNIKGR